jgi:CheY-like chemotaxis protein
VRLPLARAQVQPMRAAERHDPPQQAGRRVLVVDDNRDAAESLAMIVRLTGHEVACAHDGEEALAKAKEHRPEVVLLDIGLPRLDGYQVARAIRADPTLKGTTLVAITGWGQEEDVRRAMEAGFDAHFTKPIEHAALLEVLRAPERDLRSAS